jgi:hypothetical protein
LGDNKINYLHEHQNQRADIIFQKWLKTFGRNKIIRFQHQGGALEYITNYQQKSTIDWDLIGKPTPS